MRLTRECWLAIAALMPLAPFQNALAQTTSAEEPYVEWDRRQAQDERLRAYGPDLLGDAIDPATGSIVFEHTDVVLPGNSHLEVSIRRRRSQGRHTPENVNVEFGDWQVLVPRMEALTTWDDTWAGCGTSYATDFPWKEINNTRYDNFDYSEGVKLDAPGQPSQQVLEAPQGAQWPAGAQYTTAEGWYLTCLSAPSGTTAGFIATAPNGDVYRFDRAFSYPHTKLGTLQSGKRAGISRTRHILAATEVTDVNGNWVRYAYDAGNRLTQITSNDGRTITLAYGNATYPGLITSVTANGRTWTYSYAQSGYFVQDYEDTPHQLNNQVLTAVAQPDGRSWQLAMDGMMATPAPGGQCLAWTPGITVTHPYGVVGTFETAEVDHRGGLNWRMQQMFDCPTNEPPLEGGNPPPVLVLGQIETIALTSKTLSGPGVPTATWTYTYESDHGAVGSGDGVNWTKVVEPGGTEITYWHYWPVGGINGEPGAKLNKKEVRQSAGGALLEKTDLTYLLEGQVGSTFAITGPVPVTSRKPARSDVATITRGTDWYKTDNTYNSDFASASYSFGFPTKVDETSSTTIETRTTVTVYAHNKTKWVLGLPSSVTRNGKLFDSYTYDTLGRVATKSEFGTLRQTFTYNTAAGQQGTVASFTDSHGHVYTLSNWKRGRPQTILRPDGNTFSRIVDNNGWVTSETDGRGIVFGFSYNSMGWLTLVNRPAPFNDTGVGYSGLGTGVVETRTRGAKKTTVSYDGYLRPTLIKTEATDGTAASVYQKTSYDGLGRAIFQSWPSASSLAADGVDTTYDALSRVTSTAENVPPYATTTTQYLSGGQTRVTDPANAVVTTTARGFGDPNETEVMQVIDALGATTTMTRDVYGNVLTLAQSGTQNGFSASVTRTFWYDGDLRLCRHRAPEFGDEVFLYDSEGLLTQSGRGAAVAEGCVASIPIGIAVTRGYDALHRETGVTFPAGTPGIARAYDANGNVTSATRAGGAAWTYAYNALDAIAQEKLVVDARTYQLDYAYNANGDVTMRTNGHSGVAFTFDPDAFGRPRAARVGTTGYIAGASYHPNGLIAAASYLNGQGLSQTLNSRQKPDQLKTAKVGGATALWLTYSYDARGKVSSATDTVNAAENRSFTYDPNGRLLTASGPWGAGSYTYDALGNVRGWTQGGTMAEILYDPAKNRVSTAGLSGTAMRAFAYDNRGNVVNDGRNAFVYDFSNQPASVSGPAEATYSYDANLKRVKAFVLGKTVYTVYSRVTGGLVYRDEVTDAIKTDYVNAGGAALRLKKVGTTTTPEYTHADALGSPLAATGATGAVTWRESFTPYGEARLKPAANWNNTGFTGHLADKASGLVYMQARYYDPLIGRFYSTDPVGYEDQLNLYAYVANDPVNATDPTGEFGVIGAFVGGVIGGTVSYGAQVYKDVKGGASLRAAATSTAAAKAAATGALTGAVVGSGAGLVTAVVSAAVIGGGVEAAAGAITGDTATAGEIGAAAFNNAVATAGGVGAGKLAEKAVGAVLTGARAAGAAQAAANGAISPQSASAIGSTAIDVSGTVAGEVAGHAAGAFVTVSTTENVPSEVVQREFERLRE